MEDPDSGGRPPSAGGLADAAPGDPGAQTWIGRHNPPPTTAASAPAADGLAKRSSKRRKRKRGRKLYVREAGNQPAAAPADVRNGHERRGDGDLRLAPTAQPQASASPAAPDAGSGAAAGNHVRAGIATAGRKGRAGPAHAFSGNAGTADSPIYAALDLGTNNCRLLVAVATRPGQFRVVDAYSRIVRLGEGLTTTGRLGEAAMDRAVEALKVCADKLSTRHVRQSRLIATEACRAAANGADFLERVRAETGLVLEIIDRETEARLAVSGCGSLVDTGTQAVVLFDIGGGSSEIALIDLSRGRTPRLSNHIASWTSLPVGVVSLAERHGGRHVTPELFAAMVADVSSLLSAFEGRGALGDLTAGDGFHLLGTSGTVTTLAGVHLGLERYDRRKVDGLWMNSADVDRMTQTLLSWDFDQRVANACIGADRADLVLAGCAILEAIRLVWPAERLRVADRGLREGILSELMAADGAWRRRRWRTGR